MLDDPCRIYVCPVRMGFTMSTSPDLKSSHGPLARYAKLRVVHAQGMPGTFSPPPWVGDPDMHHGTCVTHVPWCMPGSLTSGFLWSRWRRKRSRHSRRMRNPQFCISGKRPMQLGVCGNGNPYSYHTLGALIKLKFRKMILNFCTVYGHANS